MERLNKYLAHAGVGSRRHCDELIFRGRVSVDGQVVREPGTRVDPQAQQVTVDGHAIQAEALVYWLVNKPVGYLSTNHDPAGRPRVVDLVEHVPQRVYTVGRLDEDSEGLVLMTNDGDLAYRLMHPRFGVPKTYLVQVAGKPSHQDLEQLLEGVWLSDGKVKASRVKRLKTQGESTWLEVVLREGKNREVRRMLAKLEHKVMRLRRTAIGPIRLDRLGKGKSRRLKPEEVKRLREATERRQKARAERQAAAQAADSKGAHAPAPAAPRRHGKARPPFPAGPVGSKRGVAGRSGKGRPAQPGPRGKRRRRP